MTFLGGHRAEFAAALTTVTGVIGYPYRPPARKTGDAWPLLGEITRPPEAPGHWEAAWHIYVQLPADERAASDWVDARWDLLVDALSSRGYVESGAPVNLGTETEPSYGLLITVRGD